MKKDDDDAEQEVDWLRDGLMGLALVAIALSGAPTAVKCELTWIVDNTASVSLGVLYYSIIGFGSGFSN